MSNISNEQKNPHTFQTGGCNGRRNEMEADKDKILNRLRSELIKDVDVMDEFEVVRLESVVAEIEKIENAQEDFNVTDALNNFDANILQKAIHQEATLSSIKEKTDGQLVKANKRTNIKRRFAKTASIAASILVIFVTSNIVTVVLADFHIFKPLIDWTTDVFTIKSKNEINNPTDIGNGIKVYTDFKYVQRDYDENLSLPSYIPKGYEIASIRVLENAESQLFTISVRYGLEESEENILISIVDISRSSPENDISVSIEKNDSDVKEFSVGGIDCYVFKNTDWNIGAWNEGNYSYSVIADLPLDEIEKIVRSSIQH